MLEVRMILPKASIGITERDMDMMHGVLVDILVDEWGGVTVTEGHGYWRDADGAVTAEPVVIYDVAIANEHEDWNNFRDIAVVTAGHMRQKAVYVRDGRNRATVIDIERNDQ